MLKLLGKKEEQEQVLTEWKDPFQKESVYKIEFEITNYPWSKDKITFSAIVRMGNDKTRGSQDFTAESFPELVKKVENFIQTLP